MTDDCHMAAIVSAHALRRSQSSGPRCYTEKDSARQSKCAFMFLSVKEMELRKVRFDETYEPGQIDFTGEDIVQASPLAAKGTAELLAHSDGQMRIQGKIKVEMTAQCDRCLGGARFALDSGFDLFYRPASQLPDEDEVAIDAGEAEIGFYDDGGMELEDILREQVLLALPMQRVCSDVCKGICPACGNNRNETECDCKLETHDDRWGALRKLELK